MKKQIIEISKVLSAILTILAIIGAIAKPHIDDYINEIIDSKVNDSVLINTLLESNQVKAFKLQAGEEHRSISLELLPKQSKQKALIAFTGFDL